MAVGFCVPALDVPLIESDIISKSRPSSQYYNDEEDKAPTISFSGLPLPAIKQLLTSAHRIHVLASSFLETYINRLNNLRPTHVANPTYTESLLTGHPEIFQNPVEGRQYTPQKTGPASWVEEYRVVRALWRLEKFLASSHTAHGNQHRQANLAPNLPISKSKPNSTSYDTYSTTRNTTRWNASLNTLTP